MEFDKDVFISYAHLDNLTIDKDATGWITDFHQYLQFRLPQLVKGPQQLNIWRDERLTGNEIFGPEIEAQLPKMKVMVSVVTPSYIESDWCKREMEGFYKAAFQNGGISVGSKSRIFKVVKTPVPKEEIEQLPTEIHKIFDDILDYKFYFEESTGKFKELSRGKKVKEEIEQEYIDKIEDVVQDIANLLKQLNNLSNPDASKRKIYLAETTSDLDSYRDNLVRELEVANYYVLPNKNLSKDINKFTTEVEGFINDCELSIHLISSTNYATQPEGSDKSSVILQNEIAAKKSIAGNLKRLIWIPPATAAANINEHLLAQQKEYVNDLVNNHKDQEGADLLMGTIEALKFSIFDTIKRIEAEEEARLRKIKEDEAKAKKAAEAAALAPIAAPAFQSDEPKIVYLICDKNDSAAIAPFESFLNDNNIEMITPAFDGDIDALTNAHKKNLLLCDAVIIFYGEGNDLWAKSKKSDILGINALGRTKPLLAKAVYLSNPPLPEKESLKLLGGLQINGFDAAKPEFVFKSELLNDFIKKLK